jgi:endonuclease-3
MTRPLTPSLAALRRKTVRITRILEKLYGIPRVDLDESVMDCLVGCILSQNTTDINSDRAWRNLKARFPSWASVARAPRRSLESAIRVAGLAPSRSRRIKDILALVKKTRGSYSLEFTKRLSNEEVFGYLSSLNGVGAKTAAIVLLFGMGRDVFPVDTHVHVICRRLGLAPETASRDDVYEAMKPLIPKAKALSLHLNLVHFGKDRCAKRNPRCAGCPLFRLCLRPRRLVSI